MSVLIVVVSISVAVFAGFAAWQARWVDRRRPTRCGSCGGTLSRLVGEMQTSTGASRSPGYEVWACEACDELVTTVHGVRSAYGYCPSCLQLSLALEVSEDRHHLEERCSICSHAARLRVERPPLAEVIELTSALRRRARRHR